MVSETRYMRSDERTIYGLTGYKLDITQSSSLQTKVAGADGSRTVGFSAKISVLHSDGSETVILDWFTLFSRSSNGEGYQSKNQAIPQTSLEVTDAVVVRVRINVLDQVTIVPFVTDVLDASQLDAATWTFTIYTYRLYELGYTEGGIEFGDDSHNSRIINFSWTPSVPVSLPQLQIDGLVMIQT